MSFQDKYGRLPKTANQNLVKLELGCGPKRVFQDSISVDLNNHAEVDVVGDVNEVLKALPNNSVDFIFSAHLFEHLPDLKATMREVDRVLKPTGELALIVPHFSNPHFYSDPTHQHFFGLYTMSYLLHEDLFTRKVPNHYSKPLNLKLMKVSLVFKSSRPFYLRHALKKLVGMFVNLNRFTMELYEEFFCWLFPCYEIRYSIRKSNEFNKT